MKKWFLSSHGSKWWIIGNGKNGIDQFKSNIQRTWWLSSAASHPSLLARSRSIAPELLQLWHISISMNHIHIAMTCFPTNYCDPKYVWNSHIAQSHWMSLISRLFKEVNMGSHLVQHQQFHLGVLQITLQFGLFLASKRERRKTKSAQA